MYNNINLETIFGQYINKIHHPIIAVETGCSFSWAEENLPYLSTLCIVKHLVVPSGGILYSLDNDQNNIDVCRENLKKLGLDKYVKFILGDSVESIKNLYVHSVNFIWLDSCEDSDHAQAEYESIEPLFAEKHIVCVDDFGSTNSVKWQTVSDMIMKNFNDYGIYKTPTGLIVGYRRKE